MTAAPDAAARPSPCPAERFDLRKDIQFETTVTSARFNDESGRWLVAADRGDLVSARFLITAPGIRSTSGRRRPVRPHEER